MTARGRDDARARAGRRRPRVITLAMAALLLASLVPQVICMTAPSDLSDPLTNTTGAQSTDSPTYVTGYSVW